MKPQLLQIHPRCTTPPSIRDSRPSLTRRLFLIGEAVVVIVSGVLVVLAARVLVQGAP